MTGIKQYLGSRRLKSAVFIANGSFTVPAGVTEVFLTGCGGGGGGGYGVTTPGPTRGDGGSPTQFGTLWGMSGGSWGDGTTSATAVVTGGGAGGPGGQSGTPGYPGNGSNSIPPAYYCGKGGDCGPYKGGMPISGAQTSYGHRNGGYGAGGAGGIGPGGTAAGGGGGADYNKRQMVTVTPGATYSITIGKGGKGGGEYAGNGGDGILIVEWWE